MRLLVLAAIVLSLQRPASACRSLDITEVFGVRPAPANRDNHSLAIIPARPSLFVHLGSDGPTGMPSFSTADGTPIRILKVATIQDDDWNLKRVDLDISDGTVVVRLAGNNTPVATFVVDPGFVPRTRSVELRPTGMTLWLDSDAVWFVVDGNVQPAQINDGRVHFDAGRKHRVVALYANGSEEVIYDGIPVSQDELAMEWDCEPDRPATAAPDDEPIPPEVLILLFLGLAAFAPFATPRVD